LFYLLLAIAGLAVTAAVLGELVGRGQGFTIGIFVAGLLGGLASWFMSADIGTWSVNGGSYEGELIGVAARLAPRFGLKTPPVIGSYESDDVNAFAIGRSRGRAKIFISTGLEKQLTPEQAEAVIAHELAKIASGDMATLMLIEGIINFFAIYPTRFLSLLLGTALRTAEEETPSDAVERIMKLVLEIALVPLTSLVARQFARSAEAHADRLAAQVIGRDRMVALLRDFKQPKGFANREMFTAPHAFSGKTLPFLRFLSHQNPMAHRASALAESAA
jgi:heat shock protein HtpX